MIEASGSASQVALHAAIWFVVGVIKSVVFRGMSVVALEEYSFSPNTSKFKDHRPNFFNALTTVDTVAAFI